jgi:hypothetical protein
MLFSNKNRISLPIIEEILDIDEIEPVLSLEKVQVLENKNIGLTIDSSSFEILTLLDELQIPYKGKSIEEVLKFLYDRLLFEYMEDQSYYTKETYNKFKNTFIHDQLQILIYHTKSLILWLYNDIEQIPRNSKRLYRKKEINPVYDTNYLEEYERYKIYMGIVKPERLAEYFNSLVGLKHLSIRTKAIYHTFVEELELRNIDYDSMLYSKEQMLSYFIDIVTKDNKLIVVKK